MLNWNSTMINLSRGVDLGLCPNCQKDTLKYKITPVKRGYGYCDIWCDSCNHATHISRVKTSNIDLGESILPSNLIFA